MTVAALWLMVSAFVLAGVAWVWSLIAAYRRPDVNAGLGALCAGWMFCGVGLGAVLAGAVAS